MESLLDAVQAHLDRRAGQAALASGAVCPEVGAVVFSNVYGELGRTRAARAMLARWGL